MIAIRTRCFAPSKGPAYIKAYARPSKKITLKVTKGAGNDVTHASAAVALCQKMGLEGTLSEGEFENGDHVFVFDDEHSKHKI